MKVEYRLRKMSITLSTGVEDAKSDLIMQLAMKCTNTHLGDSFDWG